MENSVSILITLEGEKEEIKSLHAKTKAWASKKCLNRTKRRYSEYWPNE